MSEGNKELDQDKVWSKIFGIQIPSHSIPGTKYTVALTSGGWTCTCMDFKIRKGSYEIVFDFQHFKACKHVIDHLRDIYYKEMESGKSHDFKYRKNALFENWKIPREK